MAILQHPMIRFSLYLWPLLLVFSLGQAMMHWTGNSGLLHISPLLTLLDMVVFVLSFGTAAWFSSRPLSLCLQKSQLPNYARRVETLMANFPKRVLKIFLITGIAFAIYLLLAIIISSLIGSAPLSPVLMISLALNFCFGSCILAPALAVANAIVFSVNLRIDLFSQGLFQGDLNGGYALHKFTSSSYRPWLVFFVTGLIPVLILSAYVYLALNDDQGNKHFLLMQALVLLLMSVSGSMLLVWTISRTLRCVTDELDSGLRKLAAGQFDLHVPVMMDDELGNLARGLNTAMRGLREREDLKDSLMIASEIQQGLLPKDTPQIPCYDLHGFQKTCFSVGGDYYDYIELDDGRIWLVIADVSGKGYPAALTMANLQAMLRGLATSNWPIEEAATYLNSALCDTLTAGRFVTLFMAKLQPESSSLVWINAGHVPPLLLSAGDIEPLLASAPPLGLVKGLNFEVTRSELAAGDTLFCYTDGVTESTSRLGQKHFGEARLRQWLLEHKDMDITELPEALLDRLNDDGRSDQDDDLTLLSVHHQKRENYE
ncbi:MAG: SpoIIE family protein phosphatase [Mariprofundus sp.]|nr:SpoIIE family protein phosphatase [Mariprofundus sp.]